MRIIYKIWLCFIILYSSIHAYAQRSHTHWNELGDGFYSVTEQGIIETKPLLQKKAIILSAHQVPFQIEDFQISSRSDMALLFTNSKKMWRYHTKGDFWLYNIQTGKLWQVGVNMPPSSLMFATISPNEKYIAFVCKHNLFVQNIDNQTITQLTFDGTDQISNGTFDWAYEEEFNDRNGFRWSPDSKTIAFWHVDAREIKDFPLVNYTDSIYSHITYLPYPKVGYNPSAVTIGAVDILSKKITWMQVPGNSVRHYIPRMEWNPNNKQIVIQQLNRRQQVSRIYLLDVTTARSTLVYQEKEQTWVNVYNSSFHADNHIDWYWLHHGTAFIWMQEQDGWRHIYAIDTNGNKIFKITNSPFDVIDICGVDEKNNTIYYIASPYNATESYLYKSKIAKDAQPELVSPADEKGTHSYNINPLCTFALHGFTNIYTPFTEEYVSLPKHITIDGPKIIINTHIDTSIQFFKVTTKDNITMDGWMHLPAHFNANKKYPVLFFVYSEPGATTVNNVYGRAFCSLYHGDIATDGYIYISLDGRGTPAPKGIEWRKSIYKQVGILNVHDQAMAAEEIRKWPFVDTSRIAVWGWSGGGSTTLNLLFQYPSIYQTGIAIAPVTNRLTYDNIYEERYMGLPQEDSLPYIKASAVSYANGLQGNLLLVHGTGDDNVHFQNSLMLINKLIEYNKQFQLMIYPNRTHSINEDFNTRNHLAILFTEFLKTHCPPYPK